MNKIYLTKRGHDGKTVVCSELTRRHGKVKSLVLAVASATAALAAPSALAAPGGSITVDQTAVIAANDGKDLSTYTWYGDGIYENGEGVVSGLKKLYDFSGTNATVTTETSQKTDLDANYTNTLTITQSAYSFSLYKNDVYDSVTTEYTSNATSLVLQDTDNTSNVTSATKFLKVTPKAPVANTGDKKGIGANTEYELSLDYNTTQFAIVDDKLALNASFISTLGGGGDVPSTYFHVNNTTNTGTGDAATNYGTIDSAAGATGAYSVTAGVNTTAANEKAVAIGYSATAKGAISNQGSSISIGENSTSWSGGIAMGRDALALGNGLTGLADGAIAIGNKAYVDGSSGSASAAIAIGSGSYAYANATSDAKARNGDTVKLGTSTAVGDHAYAGSAGSSAFGQLALADNVSTTAVGVQSNAIGRWSTAVGVNSTSSHNYSTAMGVNTVALKEADTALGPNATSVAGGGTAVGAGAKVGYGYGVAVGYLANAAANATVVIGKEAGATGIQAVALAAYAKANGKDSIVAGVSATTTADALRGVAIARESSVSAVDGIAIGYKSRVTAANATTLGANTVASHADAVALGSGSITRKATSENTATVGGVTYGGFAGNAPKSVVSFGKAGEERQLVNVAAGNISATSTDAINGSQLYLVTKGTLDQFPVIYTDVDGNKLVKAPDGNFYPADTVLIDGKYYPPGTTPEQVADGTATPVTPVDAGNVIASMNDGDNVADSPKTLANVKGNLTPTYNVGDMTINVTTGVPSDVASTEYTKSQTGPNATTAAAMYNNAATVGDILNAGWNLQESGTAKDFVKPYDTVNFVNGTGTIVNITTNDSGTVSDIRVDLNLSSLTGTVTNGTTNTNGTTTVNTDQGDKLVNVTTMVDAINNSGWNVTTKADGGTISGTNKETLVKPGSTVELIAGKNIDIKQEGQNFTFSTIADPNFTTVTIGDSTGPTTTLKTEAATPATNNNATNAPTTALNITATDGKPTQITGVGSVLNTTTVATNPDANEATAPVDATLVNLGNATNPLSENILNSAATVRDLANMGWVVSAEDGYKDVVKNANEVKFISKSDALTVNGTTTADGIREIAISLDPAKLATASVETTNLTVNSTDGSVVVPTTDGSKLVNATTVADTINNAGWTTTAVNATTGATENVVVNPGEAVNYVDGNGTTANVTVSTDANGKDNVSVSYDVDKGTITPNADGSVVGISAEEAKKLADDLAIAEKTLADLGADAPEIVKNAAKAAVYDAQQAIAKVQNKVATVENVVNAINKSGFTLTAQGENGSLVSPGETVDMKNTDGNIKISKSKDNNDVVYNMAPDVKIEKSITAPTVNANTVNVQGAAGTTALTTVAGGNYNSAGQKIDNTAVPALSVGGNQITNVANGAINATSKDAVNGSQLYALKNDMNQQLGDVNNRLGKTTKDLRAGVAGAAAIAGLPEIHLAGKSMVAVAGSTYKGQSAVAIGYSRLSDNSKVKLKLTGSSTSRGDFIGTVGVGYAW